MRTCPSSCASVRLLRRARMPARSRMTALRTLERSLAMNDSPMRPPPAKRGTTTTSMVRGSPSSTALMRARSSSVPATESMSPKCWRPSERSTEPMLATSTASVDSGAPEADGSSAARRPSRRRTETSTLPSAPGAMRAFGEMTATSPACSSARATSSATRLGVAPRASGTAISCPSARKWSSPPLAGSPRSSPSARRCGGGGSTTRTSVHARGAPRPLRPDDEIRTAPRWPRRARALREGARWRPRPSRRSRTAAGGDAEDGRAQRRAEAGNGTRGRRARAEDADRLQLPSATYDRDRAADLRPQRSIAHERMLLVDLVDHEAEGRARCAGEPRAGAGAAHGTGESATRRTSIVSPLAEIDATCASVGGIFAARSSGRRARRAGRRDHRRGSRSRRGRAPAGSARARRDRARGRPPYARRRASRRRPPPRRAAPAPRRARPRSTRSRGGAPAASRLRGPPRTRGAASRPPRRARDRPP